MELSGNTLVITGRTSGIGFEFTEQRCLSGVTVCASGSSVQPES